MQKKRGCTRAKQQYGSQVSYTYLVIAFQSGAKQLTRCIITKTNRLEDMRPCMLNMNIQKIINNTKMSYCY